MKIIKMTEKHIEEVIGVLSEAFNAWAYKRRGIARFRRRKIESIIPYLKQDPDGCFIAIEKKKIVGAIFSHVWGKLGWIGTFGVDPDYQEQGIGKQLMLKAIEYLDKNRNVTTLGLETMSDSSSNIGLYSKLGFRPAFLTISLIKNINESASINEDKLAGFITENNLEISYFSKEENKEDVLARCSWLDSKLLNGLNYNPEILLTDNYNFGDTILLKREGFIIGYAVCRTFNKYHEDENNNLYVRILVIDSDIKNKNYLDYLCNACEQFALQNDKSIIRIGINSSYWLAYEHMLNNGFDVRSAILRMIKYSDEIKMYDHYHEWLINCANWTM